MNVPHKPVLLVQGGRIIDPSQAIDRTGRILIADGKIKAIDPADGDIPADTQTINAEHQIVAPGLVDLGAELRAPGNEEDETSEAASQALGELAEGIDAHVRGS